LKKEILKRDYSIFFAGFSLIMLFVLVFTGELYLIVIVSSIITIYFGYLDFKNNKIKSVLVILTGLFCLYMTSVFYDSHLRYESLKLKPSYSGICFLGNSNTVALLYSDSPGNSYVKYTYDILDKKFTRVPKGALNHTFNYSRDGKKIVFSDRNDIFIMNADGSDKKQLTNHYNSKNIPIPKVIDGDQVTGERNTSPSFSPDGRQVIFVRQIYKHKETEVKSLSETNCDIYEIDLENGSESRLTNYRIEGSIYYVRYFSDGKRLIFGAWGHSKAIDPYNRYFNGIFNIEDKASALTPKSINHRYQSPALSFDDKIAFLYYEGGGNRVVNNVFIRTGDKDNRLTNMKSNIISVETSSDGKFIVFVEHGADQFEKHFWIMESNGGNLKEIIPPKE
jgi:hypothetical protein